MDKCCFPITVSSVVPVPNSGVVMLLAVFVPAVVLIMLISLLCVAICVVCKIRRREPTMYVTTSSLQRVLHIFNLNNYGFT